MSRKKKKEEKREQLAIKDFFDRVLPGVLKFYSDHYICGDSYRCVWAIKEYPPSTEEQAILRQLAAIAVERGCGRMEWWCLDWNRPSIEFYLSLGAEPMKDWTVYRLTGDTLAQLAK